MNFISFFSQMTCLVPSESFVLQLFLGIKVGKRVKNRHSFSCVFATLYLVLLDRKSLNYSQSFQPKMSRWEMYLED